MNNALNRLTAQDGPATLRVELQVYLPRRRSGSSKPEFQRIASFLLQCRNTAALAFARREIGECIEGLDYAKLRNENEVSKPSAEEVRAHNADLTPIPQQAAEVARNLTPVATPEVERTNGIRPSPRFGAAGEPKDRRRIGAPIVAAACSSCGQPRGSNCTACYQCVTDRERALYGRC